MANLEAKIKEDPTRSMRKLSKDMNVDEGTVRITVRVDLGLKSFTPRVKHLLTCLDENQH